MIILHCFLGCKEPLYQENLKVGQSDKREKHESENKGSETFYLSDLANLQFSVTYNLI